MSLYLVKMRFAPAAALPIANVNNIGSSASGVTDFVLLDDNGRSTGLTLSADAFTSVTSGGFATGDFHGYPEAVWDSTWYTATDGLGVTISGFSPGQTGRLWIAGHGNQSARDAYYSVNGQPGVFYDQGGSGIPNAPVEIPFAADASGIVRILSLIHI